ncbi:E1B small T-antigen [Psittacine adenovirus 3]|uniref:E1B small T-antigen n=1 Tax=Psittacine adenovirus 3 TaxID=1580497 RepID=A0A5C0PWE1_9ADEN|nr:E1B small T-antigen [Psittacine adenovirus 3]
MGNVLCCLARTCSSTVISRKVFCAFRYGKMACQCSASETRDETDSCLVDHLKSLTVSEVADLLLETTLSPWSLWWNNPVLHQERLWRLGNLILNVTSNPMFGELDTLCSGSCEDKARTAVRSLPRPYTASVFIALMAWLGPKCKDRCRDRTHKNCETVASILQPSLLHLCVNSKTLEV